MSTSHDADSTHEHAGHEPAVREQEHQHAEHEHPQHQVQQHAGHEAHADHDTSGHAGRHMSEHAGRQDHADHDMHAGDGGHGDHVGQFRRLFWIMLVVAVPTILFSPMFAEIIGYSLPDNALIPWISPVLGTVLYFWGGRPFLTGAWSELKARQPGMMLLIGLAITVAFFASSARASASSITSSTSGGSSRS